MAPNSPNLEVPTAPNGSEADLPGLASRSASLPTLCLPVHDDDLHGTLLDSLLGHDAGLVAEDITNEHPTLHRRLTFLDGLSVVVGGIIGSGIFASPGIVVLDTGSIGLTLVAWVLGGLVALGSSFIYAELGSAMPHAGGESEYLKVAFGYPWSFSFVWTMFFVVKTGGLCIEAIAFARYFAAVVFSMDVLDPALDSDPRVKALAISCIVLLSVFNCLGVHIGSALQNFFTLSKAALVLLLVVAAGSFLLQDTSVAVANATEPFKGSDIGGLGPGMVAALWAFDGWNQIVYLSEELRNPSVDLPRSILVGIFTVMGVYLLVNVAYLCVLPVAGVAASQVIAVDVVNRSLGPWAGSITALLVAASIVGAVNGSVLCGGRYLYAGAREGQIPKFLAGVSRQSGAPYAALLTQAAWGLVILLVPSSGLMSLIEYFGIAAWVFYGLTAAAMMKIRWDHPDLHRPYSVQLYPLIPIVLIVVSLYLVVTSYVHSPVPSLLSMVFVLLSFPVYYLFYRKEGNGISVVYNPILA